MTENGAADITITFREVYQATPAVIVTGGTATNLQGHLVSASASSVRMMTKNTSGTATVGRNSSLICVGTI